EGEEGRRRPLWPALRGPASPWGAEVASITPSRRRSSVRRKPAAETNPYRDRPLHSRGRRHRAVRRARGSRWQGERTLGAVEPEGERAGARPPRLEGSPGRLSAGGRHVRRRPRSASWYGHGHLARG